METLHDLTDIVTTSESTHRQISSIHLSHGATCVCRQNCTSSLQAHEYMTTKELGQVFQVDHPDDGEQMEDDAGFVGSAVKPFMLSGLLTRL